MTAEAIRTLVVDDEPLAVERMQILCGDIDGVHLVGTAHDGTAALRMIDALKPDLILLDIAMPGLDGLAVAREVEAQPGRPAIIFCTAYDEHAVAAFDLAAVDYVLKPVSAERLAKAVGRVVAARSRWASAGPASPWAQEFWVPHRSEMIRVATGDIVRIDAERDYMRLSVAGRTYLLHQTITELERRLDPQRFVRLHRSAIVRRDCIVRLAHDGMGTWRAELNDGSNVRIGRTYQAVARAIAGR